MNSKAKDKAEQAIYVVTIARFLASFDYVRMGILDERTNDIFIRRMNGETMESISKDHKISNQRTREIFIRSIHSFRRSIKRYNAYKVEEKLVENLVSENYELKRQLQIMSKQEKPKDFSKLNSDIYCFDLSVRLANVLKNEGIETLFDLTQRNRRDMLRSRNIGRKSMIELEELMKENNINFKA